MNTKPQTWLFRNMANIVTMIGFALCPFLVWAILVRPVKLWLVLVLLSAIYITDFLDGKVARKFKIVSKFGAAADRLRDKLTLFTFFAFLLTDQRFRFVRGQTLALLMMECLLLMLLFLGLIARVNVSANIYGKIKMFAFSAISIVIILIAIADEEWQIGMFPMAVSVAFFSVLPFAIGSFMVHIKNFMAQL